MSSSEPKSWMFYINCPGMTISSVLKVIVDGWPDPKRGQFCLYHYELVADDDIVVKSNGVGLQASLR